MAWLVKERGKLFLVPYFVSVRRAYTDVRLDDDGITDFRYETERVLECRCQMALGARNMRVGIELLHCGFVLEIVDPVGSYAGRHIEIRAETGILLKPVFIVGLDPVDLSVLEGEESAGPEDFIVVLQ